MPPTATTKVAVAPASTVMLVGCVVMLGAADARLTVKAASALVTLPAALVTATLNSTPLSPITVAGVV